jgi:hypothetical protein
MPPRRRSADIVPLSPMTPPPPPSARYISVRRMIVARGLKAVSRVSLADDNRVRLAAVHAEGEALDPVQLMLIGIQD